MKSKQLLIGLGLAITLVAGMGLAFNGCVTASKKLKDSDSSAVVPEPKTKASAVKASVTPEDEVRALAEEWKVTWNKGAAGDKGAAVRYLAYFSPDAEIMARVKGEQKIVSKTFYKTMLPGIFKKVGFVKQRDPQVVILNDKEAQVEMVVTMLNNEDVWSIKNVDLVLIDGVWLIKKSVYTVYFRGPGDPRDRPKGGYGEELN